MKLKKLLKPYFLIPLILLLAIILFFVIWQFLPKTNLRIVILDKTVPATKADSNSYLGDVSNNYRKHIGLYWLLQHEKIVNPDTGEYYDYTKDYYGNIIDENSDILYKKTLSEMENIPDILYLSDTYGIEPEEDSHGISKEDMNMISLSHSKGAVIIGEQDILQTGTDSEVSAELQNIFGISQTGWVGRYIYDLQDFTDVPYWAPPMYQEKYGQKWMFTGPGILLVGGGDIIVLEEKDCFNSKNLVNISTSKDYYKEFGKSSLNYYNWFELIQPAYGTEVLASYTFNLNQTGMEKFSKISDQNIFAAVTRNKSGAAPSYYFAGDFNDYVTKMQLSSFCFADEFFKLISFDRDGDIKNFYWRFYVPLMQKILDETAESSKAKNDNETYRDTARLHENKMQISVDGEWQDFTIKGFNINAYEPGDDTYTREYTFYKNLIDSAVDMGANAIRAYDLLPPEFYRALYDINQKNSGKLYLFQSITPPEGTTAENALRNMSEYMDKIIRTLQALHAELQEYPHNVANLTVAYIIDPGFTDTDILTFTNNNKDYKYAGNYYTAQTPMESYMAALCEKVYSFTKETYGTNALVFAKGDAALLPDAEWNTAAFEYNPDKIAVSEDAKAYYGAAFSLSAEDDILLNQRGLFSDYMDTSGAFPYGGYVMRVRELCKLPLLVDSFGLSTAANMYEKDSGIFGLSEKEQGNGIVRMLKALRATDTVGGLIRDLNDNWNAVSEEERAYIVPKKNNGLWYNAADLLQNTGLIALEPKMPADAGLELNDNGRISQMQLYANEGYLYITLLLNEEVDYDKEQLFIGFDTYQRNDGEYFYSKNYFANSLSGMEYVIEFESKSSATLKVTPSYNRNKDSYVTKESYTGEYDIVAPLQYGNFTESNTQFYQTGATIRVRIPWSMLNVTDPTQKLVINDPAQAPIMQSDIKTTLTDGVIVSLLIANKEDKDTAYIFPNDKKSPGYKVYKWSVNEKTEYAVRNKESFTIIKKYFNP